MLTLNSSAVLDRALESVEDFAEIIIADGGSSDETREIARRHGCRIIDQDPSNRYADGRLRNFAAAREQILLESAQPWVLRLDSDEIVTPEMADGIRSICADGSSADLYEFALRYTVNGEVIACASTYPLYMARLFRRKAARGFVSAVNERVDIASAPARGAGTFIHVLPELRHVARRWLRYLRIDISELSAATPESRRTWRRQRRSAVRWFLRDYRKSCQECVGPRLPRRYEYARLGFCLARYGLTLVIRAR